MIFHIFAASCPKSAVPGSQNATASASPWMAFMASYSASGPPVALRRRSGLMIFRWGSSSLRIGLVDGLRETVSTALGTYPQLLGTVPVTVDARPPASERGMSEAPGSHHAAIDDVEDGANVPSESGSSAATTE